MIDKTHSSILELTPAVFSILSGLVDERVGLHYGLMDRELLQEKASARAIEAGFSSLLDYYYYLRYDINGPQELSELVETLVVNETFFFREWRSIEVLVDSFITGWCAEGRKPRVWSAACASGEEPLSLAMLLEERGLLDKTEIVASDISQRVLTKAKAGRFGKRAVRQVPKQSLVDTYIAPIPTGFEVPQRLIAKIQWENKNLLAESELAVLGEFDVILCRNVLIYFSDATIRQVLAHLERRLKPGGVLIVGVSESLFRYGSGFIGEEHGGAFIYRKAKAP
jgi:chemotaxis protein methyltransferase CheR